ncbi:MAG: Do family serine endopeptidase [Calditrichaeota bacterium]|nr:Do family serine endopeptidase [Calditrichota bacterium]
MIYRQSGPRRLLYTLLFAAVCFGAGFMLATGWETPTRLTAGPTTPTALPAASGSSLAPLVNANGESPFVRVAEIVKPTVVNITAEKTLAGHPAVPFDMFDWGPFFNQPPRGRSRGRVPQVTSGGSGIIVSAEGYILTNNHVISDATSITVKFSDKTSMPAKVIGNDRETDVALIKVEGSIPSEMVANLGNSDDIRIGDWAIAVGNPFGLDWTVTVGVISARGRSGLNISGEGGPSYQDFIQTDASINFGNSGGPLVDIQGRVVGINTAINAQGQGIGFAIPINLARKVMNQLIASGEVKRGYLGVVPNELDDLKREALGVDAKVKGVMVDDVQVGTPADKGGLKGGDIIIALDGRPVEDVTDFRFRIADHPPGDNLDIIVLRGGREKSLSIKLADRRDYIAAATPPALRGDRYWLGIEVAPLKSDGDDESWEPDQTKGVRVTGVLEDSPADGLIAPGDVIVEVGGMEIASLEDYKAAVEKLKERKKAIPFWVLREGRRTFVPVRPG